MRTADFDYGLPDERIAQVPVEPRDSARLLVDRGAGAPPEHRHVSDLADLLAPGDLVVVNDTKVRRARLALRKATGGAAEVLLLERSEGHTWTALVRPGRRLAPGTVVSSPDGRLSVTVGEPVGDDGVREVVLAGEDVLDEVGRVPLPPYITTELDDPGRYQTVYADRVGSVAAPTAGLHLTEALLDRLAAKGVGLARVDLHVGLGTFRPIQVDAVADHVMHEERFVVSSDVVDACCDARRVIAVGTTTVRALESAARGLVGSTDLFLRRGEPFHLVDLLLTNFHLPRSSLLVLVDAFVGDRWRDLYATALAEGYRFLSFGDAMLLARSEGPSRREVP